MIVWFFVKASVSNEATALNAQPAPQFPINFTGEIIPFSVQSISPFISGTAKSDVYHSGLNGFGCR